MRLADTKVEIDEYVKQKSWLWYLVLWVICLYAFVAILRFDPNNQLPWIVLIPHSFNFFIHEMAHIVTGFLPAIISAAAGSFSELLLGGLLVYGAFKTRSFFASMVCLLWFMLACQSAGVYMADAEPQRLQLVSLGGALAGSDTAIHDWHFVFGELHMLGMSGFIGGTVKIVGILAGLFGLGFGAWLIYKMVLARNARTLTEQEAMLLHASAKQKGLDAPPPEHYVALKGGSVYPEPVKGRFASQPPNTKERPR